MNTKLGDICSFQSGGTPSKSNDKYYHGNIPWITTVALNGEHIDGSNAIEWITDSAIRETAAKIVPEKSILVGTRVGIGKVAINDVEMATSQDIISLLGIDEHIWDKEFLCKFIQAKNRYLTSQARGATIKGIKIETLSDLKLPEFNIHTQREISRNLDLCQSILAHRQQELSALDDLIKARFVEMFGDPVTNSKGLPTKLGRDFFKLSNGKFIPESKRMSEGIPAYGGNGVSWFTDEAILYTDTLVVGRVGFQSGNVHYAAGPLSVTDNAMYVSSYDSSCYDLHFLCDCMEHINFTRFQDPGDLKKITQKPFMEMEYISPAMEQQLEYLRFVAQVDKSKDAVKKSLAETQLLFDSLMQEYFG